VKDGHWLFKDFSSGHGGSIFDFVQIKEKFLDFSSTFLFIKNLISHLSCNLNHSSTQKNDIKRKKPEYDIITLYDKFKQNDISACRKYLINRGISSSLVDFLIDKGMLLHNNYRGISYCCFAVYDPAGNLSCLSNHQINGPAKFILGKKCAFSMDWDIIPASYKIFICEGIIDYLSIKTLEKNNIPGLALLGNQLIFDISLLSHVRTIISALDADCGGVSALIDITDELPGREYITYDFKGCNDPNQLLIKQKKDNKRKLSAEQKIELYEEFQSSDNKTKLAEKWELNRTYLYEIVDDCRKVLLEGFSSRKIGRTPKGHPGTIKEALERICKLESEKEYEATRKEKYYCEKEFAKLRLKWAENEMEELKGKESNENQNLKKKKHLKKKRKKRY